MCGIVGYIDADNKADSDVISSMTQMLRHRGPDDFGIECLGKVALGHQRLSIIDLSAKGHQPMKNDNGSVWIIYNGEFYNFDEYRDDLLKKGYKFSSRTDTEVILHLYEEYGIEKTLKRMNGMFAFAIYDQNIKRLFIARDRLGIKPCYYSKQGRVFCWGSELKSILAHPAFESRISEKALASYFSFLYIPDHECILEDVKKIKPGYYLEVDVMSLESFEKEYWDVVFEPDYSRTDEQWLDEIEYVLKDAIKLRLISDVPLGAFLSGGIDSSIVVSYMAGLMNQPVKTFSIGFYEEAYSELKWARQVSTRYHTDHYEKFVMPDAIEILPLLAYHYDEPFADSSSIPTYYVSAAAREHVTVILSGDGGDENFGGYNRYVFVPRILHLLRLIPGFLRRSIVKNLYDITPEYVRGRNVLHMLSQDEESMYMYKNRFFSDIELQNLMRNPVQPEDFFNPYFVNVGDLNYLSKMQYVDIKTYLPLDILTKVDRASMAVSLETRVPMLDYRFVELAARIPAQRHIRNGEKKYLLKCLLRDKLGYSNKFTNRRKQGFSIPISMWFKGKLESFAREQLCNGDALINEFLEKEYIEKMIDWHKRSFRDYSSHIWAILFFEFWLRQWHERT